MTFTDWFNEHVKSSNYPFSSVTKEKLNYALQILEDIEK